MKKILTILFLFVFLTSFGQVKDTIYSGETFIINLGDSLGRVDAISSNTVATSEYGGTIVDEVFYVPSTAPNDTIYTLMGNRTAGETAAILFERGSSRDTTIVVNSDSLVFGAYGTGAKPKIYGSEVITGWTLHSGNIYKATVSTEVVNLFIDDERAKIARIPKTGYYDITTVNSTTQFVSDDLNSGAAADYYSGAGVLVKSRAYTKDYKSVTTSTGDTLTINSATAGGLKVDYGFFLTNKLDFLTQAGEWVFDTSDSTLYAWMPNSDSPSNYTIRHSVENYNVRIADTKDFVTIRDLNLLHSIASGVYSYDSDDVIIQNNTIEQGSGYGLQVGFVGNRIAYNNNIIKDMATGAIRINYGGGYTINNNDIDNIALNEQISRHVYATAPGAAIALLNSEADTSTVSYNNLYNIGGIGIYPNTGVYNVFRNTIENSVAELNDLGAIYTFGGFGGVLAANWDTAISIMNSEIYENIIINPIGTTDGETGPYQTWGIYLDSKVHDVDIHDNLIVGDGAMGIFLNNGGRNIYNYNTHIGTMADIYSHEQEEASTVQYNEFYKTDITGGYIYSSTLVDPRFIDERASKLNTYNYNQYVAPYVEGEMFYTTTWTTFANWQAAGKDSLSTYDGTDKIANHNENAIYNNTLVAKTFYANNASSVTDGFTGTAITFPLTLQPFTWRVISGLNADCVLDYEDSTAPTITAFTLADTSTTFIVTPATLTSSGTATAYLLTESATAPNLYDTGWSLTPSYTFTANGTKTLYVWARDEAGNISTSASDNIVLDVSYTVASADLNHVWQFNETSGTAITDTVGTSDGTASGSTIIDGVLNKARSFNGTSDYSSFPLPSLINSGMTQDFTVCAWIRPTATTAYKRYVVMNFDENNYFQFGTDGTSRLKVAVKDGGVVTQKYRSGTIPTNEWIFVVARWDASTGTLTANYNLTEMLTIVGDDWATGNYNLMSVGARATLAQFSPIDADEIIMTNTILTTEQETELYNGGLGYEYFE